VDSTTCARGRGGNGGRAAAAVPEGALREAVVRGLTQARPERGCDCWHLAADFEERKAKSEAVQNFTGNGVTGHRSHTGPTVDSTT
jgi:hypothetical protein